MRCSNNINTNRMKVPPVQKKHRTRPVAQQEPRTQSAQEQYLRTWTQRQVPGKITSLPLSNREVEEILMRDIEFAMTCIGLLAMAGAVIGILALVAYWVSPWVVPAVVSAAGLGYIAIRKRGK